MEDLVDEAYEHCKVQRKKIVVTSKVLTFPLAEGGSEGVVYSH